MFQFDRNYDYNINQALDFQTYPNTFRSKDKVREASARLPPQGRVDLATCNKWPRFSLTGNANGSADNGGSDWVGKLRTHVCHLCNNAWVLLSWMSSFLQVESLRCRIKTTLNTHLRTGSPMKRYQNFIWYYLFISPSIFLKTTPEVPI